MIKPGIRIGKFLAEAGLTSRRNVPELLKKGTVTINGKTCIDLSYRVNPTKDTILYNGRKVLLEPFEYYMLHKPKGVVSTVKDEKNRLTVVSMIKTNTRIYPVGRLDSDSTGLLLLTNDGRLVNKLIHPRFHVAKTYFVTVKGFITRFALNKFRVGMKLEDGVTQPAIAKIIKQTTQKTMLEVTIFEGKNRQIRRMFEQLEFPVIDLKRIAIKNLKLGNLAYGKYRLITKEEIKLLT